MGDAEKEIWEGILTLVAEEESQLREASAEFHLDAHLQNGVLVDHTPIVDD